MNCDKYMEWMSAALDGELTADERRTLDEHLAACPQCAALFEELAGQSAALRGLDCEAPAGLRARILDHLPAQEQPGKRREAKHWKRWVSLAACLILVVGALVVPGSGGFGFMTSSNGGSNGAIPYNDSNAGVNDAPQPALNSGSDETAPPQVKYGGEGAAPQSAADPRSADPTDGVLKIEAAQVRYLRVSWRDDMGESAPEARLVTGTEELEQLLKQFQPDDLSQLLTDYDGEYFETATLIAVTLTEGSGSVSHTVERVEPDEDGYSVVIRRDVPEAGTCDMAAWLILVEAGLEFDGGEALNVVFFN